MFLPPPGDSKQSSCQNQTQTSLKITKTTHGFQSYLSLERSTRSSTIFKLINYSTSKTHPPPVIHSSVHCDLLLEKGITETYSSRDGGNFRLFLSAPFFSLFSSNQQHQSALWCIIWQSLHLRCATVGRIASCNLNSFWLRLSCYCDLLLFARHECVNCCPWQNIQTIQVGEFGAQLGVLETFLQQESSFQKGLSVKGQSQGQSFPKLLSPLSALRRPHLLYVKLHKDFGVDANKHAPSTKCCHL